MSQPKYEWEYGTTFTTNCYLCSKRQAVWTGYNPENDNEVLVCEHCRLKYYPESEANHGLSE